MDRYVQCPLYKGSRRELENENYRDKGCYQCNGYETKCDVFREHQNLVKKMEKK